MRHPRSSLSFLQPLLMIYLCWTLTGAAALWVLLNLRDMDLVQTFMRREGISPSVFGTAGLSWLIVGVFAYTVGDLAARHTRPSGKPVQARLSVNRAAVFTVYANILLLGVTCLWILTSAAKMGGLIGLAMAAYADSLTTRDLMLENKLFTGMRLFYAALPATACIAAGLLATGQLRASNRRWMIAVLSVNTVALLILPLVMSQRLLLLQLLLSAYFAACFVRGRLFGLHWGGLAIILFLALWVGREAITNPSIQRSAFDVAGQKLAFYVVNDMFNAFAPVSVPIHNTHGGLLLEGVMFMTFTDGYFLRLLAPRLEALDPVIGGGEFPFFTAAFVDFGAKGGALFITVTGFILRRIYARARSNFGWAIIYAQIAAALMMSSHSVYFVHQNFLFSAVLISVITLLALKRPVRKMMDESPMEDAVMEPVFKTRRAASAFHIPAPPLPESITQNLLVFTSRRKRKEPQKVYAHAK